MKLKPHIDAVLGSPDTLNVFGLILFTEQHPHIIKVLRDDDYWAQFDAISGRTLAIFSTKPHQGQYTTSSSPGVLESPMRMIWQEPRENRELLSTFHLDSTESLPQFIVFAQLPNDTILQCALQLSDESVEKAHQSLKRMITLVSNAAEGIADQYRFDTESVYAAFESQIREFKEREAILKAIEWLPFVSRLRKWLPSSS